MDDDRLALRFKILAFSLTKYKWGIQLKYMIIKYYYYIPINDTGVELSVFWPSDTESLINELRFSNSVSFPLRRGLRRLPVPAATLRTIN